MMPHFDDWNMINDEEDKELQDASISLHYLASSTKQPLFRSFSKENRM